MADKLDVLVENKNEYLEHLTDISTIPICKFFVNIANNCSSLKEFQNELVLLTKWNKQKQDGKMNTIHKLIEEDHATPQYMLKLLSEIISKSIKIKIIEHKSIIKSLKVYIPEWYEFLYKVCILASNTFWKNPVLFYKKVSSIERQNNINVIEKITKTCIKNAIRSFIPLNKIINELTDITGGGEINITNTQIPLENDEEDDTDTDEDSEEDVHLDANSDSEDDDGVPGNAEDSEDDDGVHGNAEDSEDDDGGHGNAEDSEDDDGVHGNAEDSEDDDGVPGNAEDSEDDNGVPGNAEDSEDDDNNKYSIKKTKIDDKIVRPITVLEKPKESLKDEIVRPITVLEKPKESLKDEIVRPIVVLEQTVEYLKDEIVQPIIVVEKTEEYLKDEIVQPITVLEKTEEYLKDEIVQPITVLEKTEESLKDEIVNLKESLEDTKDDDEIVMNTNEDIKVIRINKSFF